ncbi:MAG TPA: serine hydrolase [Longimicrobiaceae bacterium]|nr:serine hydrolase [Longimicrobiaceae bacterium]
MPRRLVSALLPCLLVLPASGACAAAQRAGTPVPASVAAPDTAALRGSLEEAMRGYPGVAGVAVRNLRTGESLSVRGGETFPTASLIKVAVLVTLLDEVRRGAIRLEERMGMIARDRVGGSGVLRYMEPGLPLTVGDAAWLMTTISDNTATNLILDKINIRTVWAKMDSLGLPHTRVHSKTFLRSTSVAMDSSVKYGLGVTTPEETVRLFELLHRGRANSPALDSLALAMLRANQDGTKLTRWLPESVPVAHKSGDVDRSRNDCGIIYGPEAPVALCVMTRENQSTTYAVDAPAHLLIGRIAREVFRHYNPSATLPPLPEPPR